VRRRVRPTPEGTHPDHRSKKFLYELKAGPAGGRLRRPSSAGRDAPVTVGASPTNERKDEDLQMMLASLPIAPRRWRVGPRWGPIVFPARGGRTRSLLCSGGHLGHARAGMQTGDEARMGGDEHRQDNER
jgi:hypothetical protein